MQKKNNSDSYSSNLSLKLYRLCQRFPIFRKFKVLLYFTDAVLLLFIRKPKYKQREKKKVLIIYNFAFGDGVIFSQVGRHFCDLYPKSLYEINLICQNGINKFYENENIFDNIISFDLTRSTFNMVTRFKLFKLLRNEYYDIVIDPIGVYECTTNVFMTRAIFAKEKYSVLDTTMNNKMCPNWIIKKIYTKIIFIKKANLSLLEFYAEFLRGLGLKNYEVNLVPLNGLKSKLKIPDNYFIVFPSASTLMKRWPLERYAELCKKIYNKIKIPILFCGTIADKDDIDKLKNLLDNVPFFDITCQTSLNEFIYVIKRSYFVLTNDTSTYHIAVVNQIPCAVIVGGYTYNRYVTYNFKNKNLFLKPCPIVKMNACFNCDNNCSRLKKSDAIWPCLNDIDVTYAWKNLEKYLNNIK